MASAFLNGQELYIPYTVVTPSSPAAGANSSYTVPTGTGWILQAMSAQLVTSATVANRLLRFRLKRSSTVIASWAAPAVTAASQTLNTYFGKGQGAGNSVSSTSTLAPLPDLPPLQTGDVIESFILNIDTTDALTAIVMVFSQP